MFDDSDTHTAPPHPHTTHCNGGKQVCKATKNCFERFSGKQAFQKQMKSPTVRKCKALNIINLCQSMVQIDEHHLPTREQPGQTMQQRLNLTNPGGVVGSRVRGCPTGKQPPLQGADINHKKGLFGPSVSLDCLGLECPGTFVTTFPPSADPFAVKKKNNVHSNLHFGQEGEIRDSLKSP